MTISELPLPPPASDRQQDLKRECPLILEKRLRSSNHQGSQSRGSHDHEPHEFNCTQRQADDYFVKIMSARCMILTESFDDENHEKHSFDTSIFHENQSFNIPAYYALIPARGSNLTISYPSLRLTSPISCLQAPSFGCTASSSMSKYSL